MDVTPRELREIDFRTEWKGYHRDDVDDLLERAAATIEAGNERLRQLSDRMEAAQAAAAQVEAAGGATRETEEMLRRTLVLAQRTADEAVAEAQAEARRLTEEAQAKARVTVSEAETNARRVAEGERQRLQAEVVDLGARRDALLADVDQLERFSNEYRTRLRSAIERDLDTLATRSPVTDTPRPTLHEVDVPPGAPVPPRAAPAPAAGPAPASASAPPQSRAPDPPKPAPSAPQVPVPQPPRAEPDRESRTIELERMPPFPEPEHARPAPSSTGTGPAAGAGAGTGSGDEPVEAEVLDDDAFFASLREAVRDDAPLGPRNDDPEIYVDEDADSGRFGNVFKRRR